MPALASCSSPSSFQLRWGLRCRKSPPIAQSIRFGASNRFSRIEIVRADAGNVDAEDGNEGPASQSLNSDASQVDQFAGWFGEDYEGGSSEGENRSGGIAGAALAGIFLVGGLAFASLSLTSRRQNGFKPEMQALTTEQEVLLTSESEDNKILVEERSTEEFTKSIGTGSTTGINEDYSTLESIESTSHSRVDITPEVASSGREHELARDVEASHDKETLVYEDSHMSSTISDPNYIKNELLIPEPDVASRFTDSHFQMPCDNIDSAVQDDNIISGEEEKSESRADYNSQLYEEPLGSEKSVLPQPNLILETQNNHESIGLDFNPEELDIGVGERIQSLIVGSVTSSLEGDTSQSYPSGTVDASSSVQDDIYETLNDTIISAPEGTSVNESGPPLAPSLSVFAGHYINEPGFYPQDFINRSLTSPSVLPETCFSHAGIPAPSVVSPALQVQPGKVLIPALVDQAHGQALAALQALKVIEADVQPGDLCTRREYARWLVSASSILSRSTTSKVYPAMYIENVSELAFDDITPEDPDFPYIQGLAEAGLISSRLSQLDNMNSSKEELAPMYFSAESPLSRQDLVSWKMTLEKTVLPEVDRKAFRGRSGYVDIDKINPDAWPAIAADLSSGENGIISLAFGFTRLFQPNKPVTKAQAAVALSTGTAAEIVGEELARIEAESLAETAVLEHAELVAEVEKDLNASFERELTMEREKIEAMEKLIQEARLELEKLRSGREEENNALMKERASVESEMEILSRLRNDVEMQLENLLSNKTEIAFERDRINKLHEEAERENLAIARLQYELEVERKALAMARAWAEDEAKRAREQAKILEEARGRWQKHGIKVVVDEELRESASAGVTWQTAVESVSVEEMDTEAEMAGQKFRSRYQHLTEGVKARADQLVSRLKELLAKVKGKSAAVIESLIQKIMAVVSALKHRVSKAKRHAIETKQHVAHQFTEVKDNAVSKAATSMHKIADNASEFRSSIRDGTRRAAEEVRESVEKITQRFKM